MFNGTESDDRPDPNAAYLNHVAKRDAELRALRAIWDATPVERQEPLKSALLAFHHAGKLASALTAHVLGARPVLQTSVEMARGLTRYGTGGDRAALWAELAALPADITVCPGEFLCAIACWQSGEAYLPALLLKDHPRWPDETERIFAQAHVRECSGTDPAGDADTGE